MEAQPHCANKAGDGDMNCDQSDVLDKAFVLPSFVMTVTSGSSLSS